MPKISFYGILFLFFVFQTAFSQSKIKWTFKSDGRIYSSPVIDNGLIYIGSGDQKLYAIDQETGKKVWEFETSGAVHATPYVGKKLVYISSSDGNLYALDKFKGILKWKFASKGEKMQDIWDYYISSPVADSMNVYWGSGDGHLYAINAETGKRQWAFPTNNIVHATPVIARDTIFIGDFGGNLYSINKNNGTLLWKFKTIGAQYFPKGEIQKKVLLDGESVYFGSRDYNIYALNSKTGTGLWNFRQPQGWIISSPISYKNFLYFGTSDAHLFYCMDKNSGEIIWTSPLSMRVYGEAVAHEDIIYFGTFDGKVLGLDYLTGKLKWEFRTESSKNNYSTIYDSSGHFLKDFNIYGPDTEKSEAKIHSLGSILSTPVIQEGVIYFGSSDGNLYAVEI